MWESIEKDKGVLNRLLLFYFVVMFDIVKGMLG